jgi:murein DD-endopeptidase MepM/ murein hydrolase activator NlpD
MERPMSQIDVSAATNLTEASQGLEAYFVRWIFSQLRNTSSDPMSGGMAGGVFKEMLDDALAEKISEAGGMGIAQEIEAQLSAGNEPLSSIAPPGRASFARQSYDQGPGGLSFAPVIGGKSSGFGSRKDPIEGDTRFHAGVDIAAKTGTQVYAAGPGKVTFAGVAGGYGNLVMVDHGGGLQTRYAHLSEIDVKVGEVVQPGAPVGKVGSTGRSTGPHLHFEVRRDGVAVSPEEEVPALKLSK